MTVILDLAASPASPDETPPTAPFATAPLATAPTAAKKLFIKSYGCQMNAYDAQKMTDLLAACEAFARTPRPLPVIKPVVGSISGFIAVVPAEPSAELNRLAADCVQAFDSFRAPLTAADRARL